MDPFTTMLVSTLLQGIMGKMLGGGQQPQAPAQMPQQQPQMGGQMAQMQAAQAGQQQQMNPAMQMLLQIMQQGGFRG